jgi:hypothetical protein
MLASCQIHRSFAIESVLVRSKVVYANREARAVSAEPVYPPVSDRIFLILAIT